MQGGKVCEKVMNTMNIVKILNNKGYRYVTFGWDKVESSIYYKYRNETQNLDEKGKFVLPRILEEDDLPDFYYARKVEESDVINIIKHGKIDEL